MSSRLLLCGLVLAGSLPLSGCRYSGQMSSVFAPAPPGPRRPETEMVDRMLDAIGYHERGEGRDVAQMTEAPLNQRIIDLIGLPGAWIRRTLGAERTMTTGQFGQIQDIGDLGRPRAEEDAARRARWVREIGAVDPGARVGALAEAGPTAARPRVRLLLARLDDPHAIVRAEAARAVALAVAREAVPLLEARLGREEDSLARRAQLEALVALAPQKGRVAARRLAGVDPSPWVRERACELLGRAPGTADVGVLIGRLLDDRDPMVRDVCAELLTGLTGISIDVPSETGEPPPAEVVRRLRAWRP